MQNIRQTALTLVGSRSQKTVLGKFDQINLFHAYCELRVSLEKKSAAVIFAVYGDL